MDLPCFKCAENFSMDTSAIQPKLCCTCCGSNNRTFLCHHWDTVFNTIDQKIWSKTKRQRIIKDCISTEAIKDTLLFFISKQITCQLTLHCLRIFEKVFNDPFDLAHFRKLG